MLASAGTPEYLPAASILGPRQADATQHRVPLRPTADLGWVAWDLSVARLPDYLAPAKAPAYAVSPDAGRLAAPWREMGPDPVRPDIASDPVVDLAHRVNLASVPALRQKPVPFLRIAIPDPFELAAAVRLQKPLPDNDAPIATFAPLPKPLLPIQPPPPKP